MDGSECMLSMYAIVVWRFQIWYFFECFSKWIDVYFRLQSFFEFFFKTLSRSLSIRIFSYILLVPLFAPKLFHFLGIRLLVCVFAFTHYLPIEFFSLFWNALFCLYCLSCLDIFLVFLLSPVSSGLFPRVVLFVLLEELLLSFHPTCFSVLPLSYHFSLWS